MASGRGTQFWRHNGTDFERVAGIRNYGELNATAETYDDTEVDDDSGYKKFGVGMIDPGEFELELTFKDAASADPAHAALLADLGSQGRYQIRLPVDAGKTSITFDAVVTDKGTGFPADNAVMRKMKFKLRGEPIEGVWV